MQNNGVLQIGKKAFMTSFLILVVLMILAGLLTRILPTGKYERIITGGIESVNPDSFHFINVDRFPVYRWFTSPVEVLYRGDNLIVLGIILFILIIGASFAIIEETKVLHAFVLTIAKKFITKRYILLGFITLFFMLLGSMFGIYEEMIPLVPVVIPLAVQLGWDIFMGLGMSLLAAGFGFAAAIANPFSIGVAQKLSQLPVFSGFLYRIFIFIIIFGILYFFLSSYAKKLDKKNADKNDKIQLEEHQSDGILMKKSITWFALSFVMIFIFILMTLFFPFLTEFSLPFIALMFLIAGIGVGIIQKMNIIKIFTTMGRGIGGIAPGVLLICMAMSVNYIIKNGYVLDTMLFYASGLMRESQAWLSAWIMYGVTFVLNFFVGSASAKAFLLMPVLTPLADITGLTRQIAVLAFQFGDGFSNVIYPTNPVLLIALGLSSVSYIKWFKWTWRLQFFVLLTTLILLTGAVFLHYGPF